MQRTGIVGIGKMGISHLAIASAHPDLDVVAVCDSQPLMLSGVRSHLDIATYRDVDKMLDDAALDCLFVATPTRSHAAVATEALERGVGVFVEKPLTLSSAESRRLAELASERRVANQVGYHNRYIGTFQEVARLVGAGAIGQVHHVDGKAFGQVVTQAKGGGRTWRAQKSEGGGCLHDYACHVIDLMNFVVGPPERVIGARLASIYSADVEDAVYAILDYPDGMTGTLETNWSDPTYRKMTTTITVHGEFGKIFADRQECRLWLRDGASFETFGPGWTIRYITDLQEPVWYYLRGEEYSAQVDRFATSVSRHDPAGENSFASASNADRVVEEIARVSGGAGERSISSLVGAPKGMSNADMLRSLAADLSTRATTTARRAVDLGRSTLDRRRR
ncbi:MAG: Gfo/Idh/MocA family protein [Acidimicrobiales bacterium]